MAELPRPLPPPSWRDRVAELRAWSDRLPPRARARIIGLVVVVLAVVALGGALRGGALGIGRSSRGGDVALSLPKATTTAEEGLGTDGAILESSTTVVGVLHVHAAGAVTSPGVVTVAIGARVTDVVVAAGGPTADADLDQVNLAALVVDGERVYVPHHGEVGSGFGASGGSGAAADAIVNINQADATQLESLPGVGPATAKAIVDYRNEHGRFRSVDDLLNVRGIGPSKLGQIKPHARV